MRPHPRSRRYRPAALVALLAAALLAGTAPVSAATPPYGQFLLKGTLKNSAGSSLGLTKLGAVTFESGVGPGGGTRSLLRIDQGEGLELSVVKRAARSTYSIEVQLQFQEVIDYQRILSFGPNDRDDGLYVFDEGVRLYPTPWSVPAVPIQAGDWVTVRVSRNGATGKMQVYWSFPTGIGVYTYIDSTGAFKLRNGIVDFFQDDNGEDAAGHVARITIWDTYKPVKVGIS